MTKADTKSGLNITRERVIQLLNGDLAGECQEIIAYTVSSQLPKKAPHRDIRQELEMPAREELRPATKGKDIHGD